MGRRIVQASRPAGASAARVSIGPLPASMAAGPLRAYLGGSLGGPRQHRGVRWSGEVVGEVEVDIGLCREQAELPAKRNQACWTLAAAGL
jgi:hypothetical protein